MNAKNGEKRTPLAWQAARGRSVSSTANDHNITAANSTRKPAKIPAFREGVHLVIWCEQELVFHYHGAVGPEFGAGDGWRAAHCGSDNLLPDYYIEEVAERPAHWPPREPRGRTREQRLRSLHRMVRS